MINEPYPHQLHNVVSIGWYSKAIENKALEAYMGSVDKMPEIENILYEAFRRITLLAADRGGSDSCPWPCGPGICRPSCSKADIG